MIERETVQAVYALGDVLLWGGVGAVVGVFLRSYWLARREYRKGRGR